MIEMSRFALAMIVLGAGMFGCIGTCGLLCCCVESDRRRRAKARRQRSHGLIRGGA